MSFLLHDNLQLLVFRRELPAMFSLIIGGRFSSVYGACLVAMVLGDVYFLGRRAEPYLSLLPGM